MIDDKAVGLYLSKRRMFKIVLREKKNCIHLKLYQRLNVTLVIVNFFGKTSKDLIKKEIND